MTACPLHKNGSASKGGFTLIEVLVATAILVIVVLVLLQMTLSMTKLWQSTSGSVSNYQSARTAFTTINRLLSRATLYTYTDYIDTTSSYGAGNLPFGVIRTFTATTDAASAANNYSAFTISTTSPIARSSGLHFVAGPATTVLGQSSATLYPGDSIFFQAPLGYTASTGGSGNQDYLFFNKTLNSLGFYVQYVAPVNLPAWMLSSGLFGGYHFRLMMAIQPTENFDLNAFTCTGTYNVRAWLPKTTSTTLATTETTYKTNVLADNVVLLIIRPRLAPQDEATASTYMGTANTANAVISSDYQYDSRAWETGYAGSISRSGSSATAPLGTSPAALMRNQLPSIVDVAMVCVDDTSIARFSNTTGTPPLALQVPSSAPFTNSANLDADLATYCAQLDQNHIRYRLFRSSVNMQASSWVNN